MPLTVHGKHFHLDGKRHFLRTVTYGPFSPESDHCPARDFPRIRSAGFDSIRTYGLPDWELLDQAAAHDLLVIPTHAWAHGCDFLADGSIFKEARRELLEWLRQSHRHPALGALLVGNEIPSDMAMWMGPLEVVAHLDQLILEAREIAPDLPLGYANFPTTEYLEPTLADFTAFNLYLEDPEALARYLPRLHHLAGDRPVFLTEFGLDTEGRSEELQATLLPKALCLSREAGLAGATLYAWSDDWFNNGATVSDWSFGLTRRDGSDKPALSAIRETALPLPVPENPPRFSVIICTRNGAPRLRECLAACLAQEYPDFEVIVINDGSSDGTASLLDSHEGITVAHLPPSGLSAARNHGASIATGEILAYTDDDCRPDRHWLAWLSHAFATTDHAAIGGPNIPPEPDGRCLALTTAAPGAPTHVMLDDSAAEHLPGCHLAVRKAAFAEVSGFDAIFKTAGDDVDFCWRLRDAGHSLGFCGASFVWHHRRATPWRYLKQQMGYGQAEALLFKKHPQRFSEGGIRWQGCVYHGDPLAFQTGDFIYSGPTGEAPYQALQFNHPRKKNLHPAFDSTLNRFALRLLSWLQSHLRPWTRKRHGGPGRSAHRALDPPEREGRLHQLVFINPNGRSRHHLYRYFLENGWEPCEDPDWNLQRGATRLIAATEQTGTASNRTFVAFNVSGTPQGVITLAKEVGFTLIHH